MDKRTHHMTDPWPNRLNREEACAIDRQPPQMMPGKPRKAPPSSTEQVFDKPKVKKR